MSLNKKKLPYPPYSPVLTPSDYHLFRSLQHYAHELVPFDCQLSSNTTVLICQGNTCVAKKEKMLVLVALSVGSLGKLELSTTSLSE